MNLLETIEPRDHPLKVRTANSGRQQVANSPAPAWQGAHLSPLGELQAQDVDSAPGSCQRLHPLAHLRPGGALSGPTCAARQALGDGGRLRPGRLLFHLRGGPLEAWAKRRCPGKSCCAPSILAPRPQSRISSGSPSALRKNTYSRATQGGSGSGRRDSRWRLQSRRSPRQRHGTGHRCSAPTPEGGPRAPRPPPSAGPAHPSTAHSSNPRAAAGARNVGAPIAVLQSLALTRDPRRRALGALHQLPVRSGRPRSGPCARALL